MRRKKFENIKPNLKGKQSNHAALEPGAYLHKFSSRLRPSGLCFFPLGVNDAELVLCPDCGLAARCEDQKNGKIFTLLVNSLGVGPKTPFDIVVGVHRERRAFQLFVRLLIITGQGSKLQMAVRTEFGDQMRSGDLPVYLSLNRLFIGIVSCS